MRAALHEIDSALVELFVERAYGQKLTDLPFDYETFLRNINLLRPDKGEFYPTVACVLFFGRHVQHYLPHAHVVVARIPGLDLSQAPSDANQLDGTLLDQVEDTANSCEFTCALPIASKGSRRSDFLRFPKRPCARLSSTRSHTGTIRSPHPSESSCTTIGSRSEPLEACPIP